MSTFQRYVTEMPGLSPNPSSFFQEGAGLKTNFSRVGQIHILKNKCSFLQKKNVQINSYT